MPDLSCRQCSTFYPAREGRGRQSPYCPDCQTRRQRAMTGIRMLRHTNTTINEWIEALGPTILAWKEALAEKQGGSCLRCGKHRKLYFALDPDETLVGLCSTCHAGWTHARRLTHHGTRS